jgi:hypothetical protein
MPWILQINFLIGFAILGEDAGTVAGLNRQSQSGKLSQKPDAAARAQTDSE